MIVKNTIQTIFTSFPLCFFYGFGMLLNLVDGF